MALNIVELPYSYFPDFNRGRPLFNADIYVGNVDTDPEIPANQKKVTVRQEDGTEVQIEQPVKTSAGGVPTYNGSPVTVLVEGSYSIKVLDRFGAEEYYSPDVTKGVPITAETLPTYTDLVFDSVAQAQSSTNILPSTLDSQDIQAVILGYYGGWSAVIEPAGKRDVILTTLDRVRAVRGAGWVPDGFVDHYLTGVGNGTNYVMTLNHNGTINVDQCGAYGLDNPAQDDAPAINAAIAAATTVEFRKDANYYILTGNDVIDLPSNRVLNFNGATIKATPSSLETYHLFVTEDVENVTFNGPGVIKGERNEHTGTTGEQGFCFVSRAGKNITFNNMELRDSWGDNFYIGNSGTKTYSENITLNNCVLDFGRRNCMSVISVEGLFVNNCTIKNAQGTPPQFGIDFEPNNPNERLMNIFISNLTTSGNADASIGFAIDKLSGGGNPVSIIIDGYKDTGSLFALKFNLSLNTKGYVKVRNVIADSQVKNALTFANWELTAPEVEVDGIHAIVNHSRTTDVIGDTPISFQMPNGNVGGNATIKNAEQSFTAGETGTGYNLALQSPQTFRAVTLYNIEGQIFNQQRLGGGSKIVDDEFFGQGGNFDFPFFDKKYINLQNVLNNGNQQVSLQAFQDSDTIYRLTNISETGSDALTINPPSGESLYPIGIDDGGTGKVSLNALGRSVSMRRQGGRWVILTKNY